MPKPSPRPDPQGYFGPYGGRFVPETLMAPLDELIRAYDRTSRQRTFRRHLADILRDYVGRPTPLFYAERLSDELGGARIFLKREDLLHTGAHKINNAVGQCLLAHSMGKERVIAETGAGQHGVATATAAAFLGLTCAVYMGSEDMRRQRLNVDRMRLLGAEVVAVDSGSKTLKDAINEALRDWVTNVRTTHYVLGSVLGPDPYPRMVRDFHRVIGEEAKGQLKKQTGVDAPDLAVACVGGGSNAIGLFSAFLDDRRVRLIGVEAGGRGEGLGQHAARFSGGRLGVLHGTRTLLLQDDEGQVADTHSVSAGLDYPAVGPEHAFLRQEGRIEYTSATDAEAIAGFHLLARTEGILPALESAHAIAEVTRHAPRLSQRRIILVNLSGRGDKDVESVIEYDRAHKAAEAGGAPVTAIDDVFAQCAREGRAAFIPFIMAGDPSLDVTASAIAALAAGGADIIELGVPFSDPIADGPINQRAAVRALKAGAKLSSIFELVARHRDRLGVPIVLFTYFNPIHARGIDRFAEQAAASGVDGVLCVDLPPEEGEKELVPALREHGVDSIYLLAPTSTKERIDRVGAASSGFVYYVSRTGVTGERAALPGELVKDIKKLRKRVKLPLAVGFGISSPAQVAAVGEVADGVVVGSALVRLMEEHGDDPALPGLLEERMRELTEPLRKAERRRA